MNIAHKHSHIEIKNSSPNINVNVNHFGKTKTTNVYDKMAVLTLDKNGMIRDCNKAGGRLLGCSPAELTWQHISKLLPQLIEVVLFRDKKLNPRLRYISRIGQPFEMVTLSGARYVCALFFREVENLGAHFLRVIICPVEQRGSLS